MTHSILALRLLFLRPVAKSVDFFIISIKREFYGSGDFQNSPVIKVLFMIITKGWGEEREREREREKKRKRERDREVCIAYIHFIGVLDKLREFDGIFFPLIIISIYTLGKQETSFLFFFIFIWYFS